MSCCSREVSCACRSFADSKTLTEEKREVLYEEVLADQGIGFAIDSISAADISSQMLRRLTYFWLSLFAQN